MPRLTGTVGNRGANAAHDVALVQAILHVIKNRAGESYYPAAYDGICGTRTLDAISRFKSDHQLGPTPITAAASIGPQRSSFVGPPAPGPAPIDNNSQTWRDMVAALPSEYKGARIIPGTLTVYLEMSAADAAASASSIAADSQLDAAFRQKIRQLVDRMQQLHGIALTSPPADGRRRTFQQQANLSAAVTGAGPGESNHQFGQAVDIGFNRLAVVARAGGIHRADYWLNHAGLTPKQQGEFWEARNKIAFGQLGLFPTSKHGDFPHIQAYPDTSVSCGKSLVALLTAVGKMKWKLGAYSGANQYQSDLGYGGAFFSVGTAKEIFLGNATITAEAIASARGTKSGKLVKPTEITQPEIAAVRRALKADFDAADANWTKWKPLK
jgi:hypothetical protein